MAEEKKILEDVKSALEVNSDSFDNELLLHINSTLLILQQIGAFADIPEIDNKSTWSILNTTPLALSSIKIWMSLRIRLLFDPPQSSTASTAVENTSKELEWRIYMAVGGNLNE